MTGSGTGWVVGMIVAAVSLGCAGGSANRSDLGGGSDDLTADDPGPVGLEPLKTRCSAWVKAQRATGIRVLAPATNAQKREQFLADGGGLRKVGNTYYAMWFPDQWFDSQTRRVFFVLHGTAGAPEFEWVDWHQSLAERGWGFIGLNHLVQTGGTDSYLDPKTILAHFETLLAEMTAPCDLDTAAISLMGFSVGSVQGMRVLAADRRDRKLFLGHLANSGGWGLDDASLPPDLAAVKAAGDPQALAGARLWMYCGEKDFDHGWPMCDEMETARAFFTTFGAHVEKLYRNPTGDHHSMCSTGEAVAEALAWFETLQ